MKCIKILPLETPEVIEINNDYRVLQGIVGGNIEASYPFEDKVAIVCNDSGKIYGLPYNRAIHNEEGRITDVIAGPMLIVGLTKDDFGDLSDDLIEKYTELFWSPEIYLPL